MKNLLYLLAFSPASVMAYELRDVEKPPSPAIGWSVIALGVGFVAFGAFSLSRAKRLQRELDRDSGNVNAIFMMLLGAAAVAVGVFIL